MFFLSIFQMRVQCQQESITTEGVVVGSGAGPTELYPNGDEADDVGRENLFVINDTREALSHDGSEHNSVSIPSKNDGLIVMSYTYFTASILHTCDVEYTFYYLLFLQIRQ